MRSEQGDVSAQTVIAVPVIFLTLMIAVQATVFMHSAHVASVAAMNAASQGAVTEGSDVAALAAAIQTVAELSGRLTDSPQVVRDQDSVTVTVRLEVPEVAPFFDLTVTRTAREPIERFVSEVER